MGEYGYVVALDDTVPVQIHALTVGKFSHPIYGPIDITPERLTRFAASVNEKTIGIDSNIDYEHKARDGKAAGWVKSAEVKGNDLYLNVEWTDPAREAIQAKQWRYFSPEFTDEWTDAEGNKHKDVLLGGALTNRPFLKNLVPLNFDEFYFDKSVDSKNDKPIIEESEGGNTLDPKKFAELLGIATEDESVILEEVKKLHEYRATKLTDEEKTKAFSEAWPEEAKRLHELENTNKLMETDTRIKEWSSKGLPPVLNEEDKLQDFRMGLSPDTAAKFDEIIATIIKTGVVKLDDEQGGHDDPTDDDAVTKFEGLIKKYQEEDKLNYRDAVKKAQLEEPELSAAYVAAGR